VTLTPGYGRFKLKTASVDTSQRQHRATSFNGELGVIELCGLVHRDL
jgi:hypothetical protein